MANRMFFLIAAAGLAAVSAGCAVPGTRNVNADRRQYSVARVQGPIVIDGRLDDAAWQAVPFSKDFEIIAVGVLQMPERFATRMKMLRDDTALYVGIEAEDDDIWSTFTERDDPLMFEETAAVFLDPQGGGVNYFGFYINPLNALFDIRRESGSININLKTWLENARWQAEGIEHAVHIDGSINQRNVKDNGWTVEMKIPFADIGARPEPGDVWRAQAGRIERGRFGDAIISAWQKTLIISQPEDFGSIIFK